MMNRIKQRNEAIKRMEALKVCPEVIEALKQHGQLAVNVNGHTTFTIKDKIRDMVKEFERMDNAYVFYCIYCETEIGELYHLLYVSDDKDYWKYERKLINNGVSIVYHMLESFPEYSQRGCVDIQSVCGVLRLA